MAETPSTMIPLGSKAKEFILLDTISHKMLSLAELKSDYATVIMFICNHCPYVKHIIDEVVNVAKTYQSQDISFIAINSNDAVAYPADNPEKMHEFAKQHAFSFPYLYDETQKTAKDYHAACTPDFFVFDKDLQCVYRGRFDEATPGNNKPVTGHDLKHALNCILKNAPIDVAQIPSLGCNIKWKKEINDKRK